MGSSPSCDHIPADSAASTGKITQLIDGTERIIGGLTPCHI